MKRIWLAVLLVSLAVGMTACGKKNNQDEAPTSSEESKDAAQTSTEGSGDVAPASTEGSENAAQTSTEGSGDAAPASSEESGGEPPASSESAGERIDLSALEEMFQESQWAGVDAAQNKYILQLEEGEFRLAVEDPEGTEILDGSYTLSPDKLLSFFEDKGLEVPIEDFDFEVSLDASQPYVKVNDAYLTRVSVTEDLEAQLESLDLAASVGEYLGQGHCWIACYDDWAVVLFLSKDEIDLKILEKKDGEISVSDLDGQWSLNAEFLALLGSLPENGKNYSWNFEEEEDLKVLTLTDEEEEAMVFYETTQEDVDGGVEMAKTYLENRQDFDGIEDLTTVLAGYKGVSIVDAFVLAGLDPSLENRGRFAEAFEIENYRGTAEQNLFLLESMGGEIG